MSSVPYPLPPSHPHHQNRCLPGTSYTTALRNDVTDNVKSSIALGTRTSMFSDTQVGNDTRKQQQPSTLDKLHHTHVNAMVYEKKRFEKLKKTLKHDKLALEKLHAKPLHELNDVEIQHMFQLETAVSEAEQSLKKFDKNGPFTDYFMETGDILFEYYENLDQISKGTDARRKRTLQSYSSSNTTGPQTVIDFFRNKTTVIGEEPTLDEKLDESSDKAEDDNCEQDDSNKPVSPPTYQSRQVLLNKYLEKTDPNFVPVYDNTYETLDTDECPDCGTERFLVHYEATLVCPNPSCSRTDVILIDSYKPSYKDAPREGASYYSYKRINHFNEWLAQFQAKETTDIPDDVYHKIYVELKKERIENMAHIKPAKMKEILKRLKLNKYYEHIPHITNRINGQPAPVMDRKTEEKLRSMFKEIQAPFLKHCPAERKNFLSYSYVLHKFCQLLGLDDFLKCFQLLKS